MSNYVEEYRNNLRNNLLGLYSNAKELIKSDVLETFEKGGIGSGKKKYAEGSVQLNGSHKAYIKML